MSDGINKLDSRMKIGARILNDISMKVLLPNYENIFEQITEIRENAISLKEAIKNDREYREILKKEPEFAKHHNNVFSILGERGSGKTSVELTLKYFIMECLQKQDENSNNQSKNEIRNAVSKNIKPNDTVLPIIVPQDMDADSNSMGWIIGFFNEIAKEIEKEYQQNRSLFQYKDDKCYACGSGSKNKSINYVTQSLEKVRRAYFLRQEQYKKLLTDISSKKEYVDENSETLMKDIDLVKAFKEFIDEYVGLKRSQNNGEEPLIYIFFDDVDISTKKCIDVLETIMRFLSHSNIVVFVAGNNKTFKETIVIDYLKDEGLLNTELMNSSFEGKDGSALETRKILAYDYLKKVLSPALRYEMQVLSDTEKIEFKYNAVNKSDDTYKILYELIIECFGLDKDNFLVFNGKEKLTPYFMIFDNKPRGLMNVYYYLNGKAQRLKELKKDVKEDKYKEVIRNFWTANELERLLDLIIESSSDLNIHREKIKNIIVIEDEETKANINLEEFNSEFDNNELKLTITMLAFFIKGVALEDLNTEVLNASMAKILSETLLNSVKINELKKQEKERKYNFFFETDTAENNIYLFLKIWEEIKNRNLNGKDFFDFYLENLYKMTNIKNQNVKNYKTIITYLNRFFYDSKTKLNRIIENIVEFKNDKEIKLFQKRKLYLENFYLVDILDEALKRKGDYISRKEFEDKINNNDYLGKKERTLNEDIFNNIDKNNDMTINQFIEYIYINLKNEGKKIQQVHELLDSLNNIDILINKIRSSKSSLWFQLTNNHLTNNHLTNNELIVNELTDNELNVILKISNIYNLKFKNSFLSKSIHTLELESQNNDDLLKKISQNDILEILELYTQGVLGDMFLEISDNLKLLALHKENPLELLHLKNTDQIENKIKNNFNLFHWNRKSIKNDLRIIKNNNSKLIKKIKLIKEIQKLKGTGEIEDLFEKTGLDLFEILTDYYSKDITLNIFKEFSGKNKRMDLSDYNFFIDLLMDRILDLEDEMINENILLKIEENDIEKFKTLYGKDIINKNNLLFSRSLPEIISEEDLEEYVFLEKYYNKKNTNITETQKLKFKVYVNIFNSLQSLKYDREKEKQQNDEISKIYNGIYKGIKENKKLSRFLPLEAK